MKYYLWIVLVLFTIRGAAQEGKLPAFKMLMTNGQYFTSKDLSKKKPVVLIYFSPDCEHCQKLMAEVFKNINKFDHSQLVLITFKPLDDLRGFERQYRTYNYPFIKAGTEGNTFFIRYYYKLATTPFTALFDKKGNLVISYRRETPVNDLLKRLKTLN
jgi:Uncharacterized protein SCO1/SenC/PrrC, involved in biogenesis of respiratory and photosynthetic systems